MRTPRFFEVLLPPWLTLTCAICLLSACGGGAGGDQSGGGSISLNADARSASEIYLSWSEPSGGINVSPYVIARNDASSTQRINSSTDRNYLVAGLSPGTRYCFVIRNPFTGSTMSNTACATTPADQTAPSRPTEITATPLSPIAIVVDWQSSIDEDRVDGYRVNRDESPLTTVDGSTFQDDNLRPDTRYCYRISAFDPSGNESVESDQTCATTIADTEAPSTPQDVGVESSVIGGLSVLTVNWSPSSDDSAVEGYTVLRDGVTIADTADTRFDDSDLTPDASYCYSVIARDLVGKESVASEEACAIESWRKLSLSETGVGAAVVVTDLNNVPLVAYKQRYYDYARSEFRSTLKVGRIDGGLTAETLDDSFAESYIWGEFSLGMVSAANDSLHIVHQTTPSPDSRELRYVTRAGAQTEQFTIASPVDPLYGASIDVDSIGIFHACFNYNNALYYANTSLGSWVLTELGEMVAGANGGHCKIAVGIADTIHLIYLERLTYDLRYITRGSAGWSGELVDRQSGTSTNTIYHTAIATDSKGAVHVAYAHDFSENDLEYATNASGSWVIEKVDDSGTVGYASAIAVDSADRVFIIYQESGVNRRLRFATKGDGIWETAVLSSTDGNFLSIAVDSLDFSHIVFAEEGGQLAYLTNSR